MGKLLLRLGILYGVAAYSAPVAAQGDTYLMRHMEYGKTVKPYSPSRPSNRGKQLEILAADSSIIPPGELPVYKPSRSNAAGDGPALVLMYPKCASRNGLQGDIVVKFAVAPDGKVVAAKRVNVDSLSVFEGFNRTELSEEGRNDCVDDLTNEALWSVSRLRLAPANRLRFFQVTFRFRLM